MQTSKNVNVIKVTRKKTEADRMVFQEIVDDC